MQNNFWLLPFEARSVISAGSRNTILVVDDDPDIRSLTRTFLEHEGYQVYSSGDAARAVQIFNSVPQIDLLIADLYMPNGTGMELAFDLREMKPDLPVVMISGGFVDLAQKMQLQREGWRFLGKPFMLPELLSMVHQILASGDRDGQMI